MLLLAMRKFFIVISYFLLIACTKESDDKASMTSISLENIKEVRHTKLTLAEAKGLETTSENLMGLKLRIRFSNQKIFIMDEEAKQKSIQVFHQSGKYLGAAIEEGEGPDQVPSIIDFHVSEDDELFVLSGAGDKVAIYQIDENPIQKFEVNYIATSFTKLPNGKYLLYGGYNSPFVQNRIIKLSNKGNLEGTYLPNDYSGKLLPMSERNFYKQGNELFIIESFSDHILTYEHDSLHQVMKIDFGAYAIPKWFWKSDIMESFPKLNEKGFGNIIGVYRGHNLTLAECMIQGTNGVEKELLLIDHKGSPVKVSITDAKTPWLFHPVGIDDKDNLLFITYRSILEQ